MFGVGRVFDAVCELQRKLDGLIEYVEGLGQLSGKRHVELRELVGRVSGGPGCKQGAVLDLFRYFEEVVETCCELPPGASEESQKWVATIRKSLESALAFRKQQLPDDAMVLLRLEAKVQALVEKPVSTVQEAAAREMGEIVRTLVAQQEPRDVHQACRELYHEIIGIILRGACEGGPNGRLAVSRELNDWAKDQPWSLATVEEDGPIARAADTPEQTARGFFEERVPPAYVGGPSERDARLHEGESMRGEHVVHDLVHRKPAGFPLGPSLDDVGRAFQDVHEFLYSKTWESHEDMMRDLREFWSERKEREVVQRNVDRTLEALESTAPMSMLKTTDDEFAGVEASPEAIRKYEEELAAEITPTEPAEDRDAVVWAVTSAMFRRQDLTIDSETKADAAEAYSKTMPQTEVAIDTIQDAVERFRADGRPIRLTNELTRWEEIRPTYDQLLEDLRVVYRRNDELTIENKRLESNSTTFEANAASWRSIAQERQKLIRSQAADIAAIRSQLHAATSNYEEAFHMSMPVPQADLDRARTDLNEAARALSDDAGLEQEVRFALEFPFGEISKTDTMKSEAGTVVVTFANGYPKPECAPVVDVGDLNDTELAVVFVAGVRRWVENHFPGVDPLKIRIVWRKRPIFFDDNLDPENPGRGLIARIAFELIDPEEETE